MALGGMFVVSAAGIERNSHIPAASCFAVAAEQIGHCRTDSSVAERCSGSNTGSFAVADAAGAAAVGAAVVLHHY